LLFLAVIHVASVASANQGDVINYKQMGDKIYLEAENADNRSEYLNASVASKKNADQLLAQAQIDYEKRKFEDSRQGAEKAKKIYTEINYISGIGNATTLIKNNNDLERRLNEQAQINMRITTGIVIVGFFRYP
jgi:hypothetical protein